MIRPKPDIPERVPVLSFPTPEGQADLLFYEFRDGSLPKNKTWEYGNPHPDSAKFPHHELVFVTSEGGSDWQRWYYAADRENQHLYNWQVSDTPDWPQLVQTFVIPRDSFSVSATYEMPPLAHFAYPLEWSVTGVDERPINDEVLASRFVTVVVTREKLRARQVLGTVSITTSAGSTAVSTATTASTPVGAYLECEQAFLPAGVLLTLVTSPTNVVAARAAFDSGSFSATVVQYAYNELVGREFDPDTNSTTPYRRIKVPAGTSVPTGVQSDGSVVELQPVNSLWSIMTTKQAAGLAGSAFYGKKTRTFQIVTNWAWPAVLDYVKITPVYADDSDIYSAVTGYVTTPIFAVDGYSGPCLATIVEEWTSKLPVVDGDPTWDDTKLTSPHLPQPTPLLAKSISFRSPLLDVTVPECLHDYVTFYAANFQQEYLATNYTRWPGSVIAEADLRPHQGGWLKRVMIVNAPSLAGTAPALYLQVASTFATSFELNWTNLPSTTALELDVSSDPAFKTGFLPGFKEFSALGLTTKLVESASRGVPYYCRLTVTRTVMGSPVTSQSNIVAVMCPPQPEISLSTPGPDGSANTADDEPLPAGTGVLAFGEAQTTTGSTKLIIIRNVGLLSLSGISVEFTGAYLGYFSVVGSLPESVAPGGYAVVAVKMLPSSAVGAVSGTMVVTSNAINTPSYVVGVTGAAVQPEIDVRYASVSKPSGSTVSVGTVNTGSSSSYSFSIHNTGTGPLTAVVSVSGVDSPSPWVLLSSPEDPIPAGGSATFVVGFTPTAVGAKSLGVSIDNNDPTGAEDPYLLNITATGTVVGRIDVTSPSGVEVSSGDPYYFGFSDVAVLKTAIFTVANSGLGTLGSLSASLSGTDAAEFSLGALSASIAAGGATTLSVGFTPTAGTKTAALTIASDDPDQPTFVINLSGNGGSANEIQVESPLGTVLTDGVSRSAYGSMLTGTSRTSRFWISNVGNLTLGSLAVTITGPDAAKFFATALTPAVTTLAPSDSAYFDVTLTPGTDVGPLTATLNIASDDADENPFTVELFGFSYAAGSISTFQPGSLLLGQSSMSSNVDLVTSSGLSSEVLSRPAVSQSGRVAVSDTRRNRVLIWDSYSELSSGKSANLVLGQADFTSSASFSITASNLVLPKAVAWYGEKLLVSDAGRNRILIWDNPTTNGQAASLVLGQPNFTSGNGGTSSTKFRGIVDLFVVPSPGPSGSGQAGKIIAADPGNYRVLVWNTFPTSNYAAASIALGQTSLTAAVNPGFSRTYVASGLALPRFKSPSAVCVSPTNGKLYIADAAFQRVLLYTAIPSTSTTPPSGVLFQADITSSGAGGISRSLCNAPFGLSVNAAGHLAVSDFNNRRALLFYSTPVTGSLPDAVVGQPDFTTNSIATRSETTLNGATGLTWQSGDLLVTDNNRVMIFKP
jgi:hypothetical protein